MVNRYKIYVSQITRDNVVNRYRIYVSQITRDNVVNRYRVYVSQITRNNVVNRYRIYVSQITRNNVSFVTVTISSSFMIFHWIFYSNITRRVILEEQELFTSPTPPPPPLVFNGIRVAQFLDFFLSLLVFLSFLVLPLHCLFISFGF